MGVRLFWRIGFALYFIFLSWQLFTPVTIISAGNYDKLYHFGAFFVLAIWALLSWQNIRFAKLGLVLVLYAGLTEIIQYYVPGRSFSVFDWLADSAGIIVAVSLSITLFSGLISPNIRH